MAKMQQYLNHSCCCCLIPMKRDRKRSIRGKQIERKKNKAQQKQCNLCSKLKLYLYHWRHQYSRRRRIGGKKNERKKSKAQQQKHLGLCSSSTILSEDLISMEILPRLPAKDVLRWRSLSKSWNAVIPNPFLARLHLVRARKRLPKLMFITIDGLRRGMSLYAYDLSSSSKSHGASLLFNHLLCQTKRSLFRPQHCNGLVLLSFSTGPFFVCNPATQELVILPKRHSLSFCFIENFGAGFSFIPSLNAYKVVRYFLGFGGLRFEVFTLGSDSSWRVISDIPPDEVDTQSFPISAGESIYFRVDGYSLRLNVFIALNLKDEKFRVVDPPSSDLTDYDNMEIFDLEGKPCFVYNCRSTATYSMWISMDCENHEWIPICSFSVEGREEWNFQPVCVHSGKLLLLILNRCTGSWERLEYYDPQSISFTSVVKVRNVIFEGKDRFHDFCKRRPVQMYLGIESLVSVRA